MEILKKAWTTCPPERVAMLAIGSTHPIRPARPRSGRSKPGWPRRSGSARTRDPLSKLAAIRMRQGRFDEAENLFRRSLASNPRIRGLNNLAWLLSHRDRASPGALELINRAIDVAGEDPGLLDTRAVIFLQLGQPI